ncbi:MAG: hypothetical protein FGM22_07320 [Burkholderiaceae bacterium]|nr:hypothetical protein [Burkholderiaceae bacterium]
MSVSQPMITRINRKKAIKVTTASTLRLDRTHFHNGGAVTYTLPSGATLGQTIEIVGNGSGVFTIGQLAGQTIRHLTSNTTTGVGGSLTAGTVRDVITLICSSDDGLTWTSTDVKGTFTVV